MAWTDEAITNLDRFYKEGFSASQIAMRLGPGFTRNAVIGKICRLNLNGIKNRPKQPRSPRQPRAVNRRRSPEINLANTYEAQVAYEDPEKPSVVQHALVIQRQKPAPRPLLRPLIQPEPTGQVTIMELSSKVCKWPIGEPGQEGFHFCGSSDKPDHKDVPYCTFHSNKAYQPPQDRGKR